jgi:hypothetical protein
VRRPTPARSATSSAFGEIAPARTNSSIAATIRRRLVCLRTIRPSTFSAFDRACCSVRNRALPIRCSRS